jgi:uncharacterized membrane-anchored protein YjiN (DUF445 family)
LRAKTKSFFEDTFILLIIGILIYLAYSFFFSTDEKTEIVEDNKTTIEKKVEALIYEKLLNTEVTKEEIKKDEIISEELETTKQNVPQDEQTQREQIEEAINNKDNTIIEESIEPTKEQDKPAEVKEEKSTVEVTKEEQPVSEILDEKAKIALFYKNIEKKIYSTIENNIDKNLLKSGEYVNIRVTILKDGKYEQLTFIDGNKKDFNLIKSSIHQAFPVEMDSSIESNFPRYFRMKVEF